jgi:hypothetical protein
MEAPQKGKELAEEVRKNSGSSRPPARLDKLLLQLQDEVQKEKEDMAAEWMRLEKDRQAFEEERQLVMGRCIAQDDDIVELNVGGNKMACMRSTLCQVKGSLLEVMFSGRWEENLKKDKQGRIFLDMNPAYFMIIVNYLRAKRIESPERPAQVPVIEGEDVRNFENLAHYLGIGQLFELHLGSDSYYTSQ